MLTAAGTGEVFGRMYHNCSAIWQGFSKNLYGLMGYQKIPFLFLLAFMFIGYVCPYFFVFYPAVAKCAAIAVLLNVVLRFILSYKYKDPFITILLHPLGILFTIIIGLNSMRIFKQGNLEWKGRKIFIDSL
jgi:hypothetical protein